MSVTIIPSQISAYTLTPDDIRDGRAYESEHGAIVIGNAIAGIRGFSICGGVVAFKDQKEGRYREINLEIRVV